jgi:tetratricopeptide (TPR) repeat protein
MKLVLKALAIVLLIISFTISAHAQEKLWNELYDKLDMLYQQGRYSEAENVAKDSLQVAEKTFGPDHPKMATSLNNLAFLYNAQGNYAESEPLLKQSLKIREKTLGRSIPMWRLL